MEKVVPLNGALEHQPIHKSRSQSISDQEAYLNSLDDTHDYRSDSSGSDFDIEEQEDHSHIPRHLRVGREIFALRRSRWRLYLTMIALVIFWVGAVVAIAMLKTSGHYRNPFHSSGNLPSFPT